MYLLTFSKTLAKCAKSLFSQIIGNIDHLGELIIVVDNNEPLLESTKGGPWMDNYSNNHLIQIRDSKR